VSTELLPGQIVRLGYQQWLEKVSSGTLAPVAVAGLVVDNSLGLQGARIHDSQARLESRWTDWLFTVIGGERIDLNDPDLGPGYPGRELYVNRATAAVNAILGRQFGAFLRYGYSKAEADDDFFEDRPVPGVPEHAASGGLVWISPLYVKVSLAETYVGRQYASFYSDARLDDYWSTDLFASWEALEKRIFLSLAVGNIFNVGDPAPGRTVFGSFEVRF
jgi:hypothetical protein